jgi:hypothetical protein
MVTSPRWLPLPPEAPRELPVMPELAMMRREPRAAVWPDVFFAHLLGDLVDARDVASVTSKGVPSSMVRRHSMRSLATRGKKVGGDAVAEEDGEEHAEAAEHGASTV